MRQDSSSSNVQIKEPALKEIKKRHGWLKGSCATGCGCIILFIGALYLVARLIIGAGPSVGADFPSDFPRDIPQIHPDKIIKVTTVDGTSKSRVVFVATALPRLLLTPILSTIDPNATITEQKDTLGRVDFERTIGDADYLRYLGLAPNSQNTKTVVVTWSGINDYPSLIADDLEKRLQRAGYTVTEATKDDPNTASFVFTKDAVSGNFRAIDMHPNQPGTEFAELMVNYP